MPRSDKATSRRTAGEDPRQGARLGEDRRFRASQRPKRSDTDLRIGVGQALLDFAHAVRTELGQEPDCAGAMKGLGSPRTFLTAGSAAAPCAFSRS